jgi:hypothetical protein
MRLARALIAAFLVVLPLGLPAFAPNEDILVNVRKDGAGVAIDVVCPVDAPWPVVWEVLTDYAHMPQYISNIQYSVVEEQNGNVLHVRQKGKASRGPLTLTYDMLREVELVPQSENPLAAHQRRLEVVGLRDEDRAGRRPHPHRQQRPVRAEGMGASGARSGDDRGGDAKAIRRIPHGNPAPERNGAPAVLSRASDASSGTSSRPVSALPAAEHQNQSADDNGTNADPHRNVHALLVDH